MLGYACVPSLAILAIDLADLGRNRKRLQHRPACWRGVLQGIPLQRNLLRTQLGLDATSLFLGGPIETPGDGRDTGTWLLSGQVMCKGEVMRWWCVRGAGIGQGQDGSMHGDISHSERRVCNALPFLSCGPTLPSLSCRTMSNTCQIKGSSRSNSTEKPHSFARARTFVSACV